MSIEQIDLLTSPIESVKRLRAQLEEARPDLLVSASEEKSLEGLQVEVPDSLLTPKPKS